MIRTLAERKAAAAGKAAALDLLRPALAEAARRLGGRCLLYGSAARGALWHGSDIDLLLDFPTTPRRRPPGTPRRTRAPR